MQYQLNFDQDIVTTKLSGALTFGDHEAFGRMLDEIKGSNRKKIVFDLGALASIDSGGLGMFLLAEEQASEKSMSLEIANAKDQVQKVLSIAGFSNFVEIS